MAQALKGDGNFVNFSIIPKQGKGRILVSRFYSRPILPYFCVSPLAPQKLATHQ